MILRQVEAIWDFMNSQNYDNALSCVEDLLTKYPYMPILHVYKGICIQMSEAERYDLNDAKDSYLSALKWDTQCVDAIIELAWFEYACEDDARNASIHFDQAMSIIQRQLEETISGKIGCMAEIDTKKAAENYIEKVIELLRNSEMICEAIRDIESMNATENTE